VARGLKCRPVPLKYWNTSGLPADAPARRSGPVAAAAAGGAIAAPVTVVLDRSLRRGLVSPAQHAAYDRSWYVARRALRGLRGERHRQLSGAIANLRALSARGAIRPSRMRVLFLNMRRNAEFWRSHNPPPDRSHVEFSGSPLVFQYFRGTGLHFNPLATAGRANYYIDVCRRNKPGERRGPRCMIGRRLLSEMSALATNRGGFPALGEYHVPFGGGTPPWLSGIAQSTAIMALARGSRVYGEPGWLAMAKEGVRAFAEAPPVGQRVRSGPGNHYLIYSFAPRLRVLNAFTQSLNALYDLGYSFGDPRAKRLFRAGERTLRSELHRYETRSWSLYSLGGGPASLGYHTLARDFLGGLCQRTGWPFYCRAEQRFTSKLAP